MGCALNTREFVARWHNIVEQRLVKELADLLHPLAAESGSNPLAQEQCAALSAWGSRHAVRDCGDAMN